MGASVLVQLEDGLRGHDVIPTHVPPLVRQQFDLPLHEKLAGSQGRLGDTPIHSGSYPIDDLLKTLSRGEVTGRESVENEN